LKKVISFITKKGGTGKTTTALCVAHQLTRLNKKVLLIDMDAQCNLTKTFIDIKESVSVFDSLVSKLPADPVKINSMLFLLKGDPRMNDLPLALKGTYSVFALRTLIEGLSDFDVVIIDSPPKMDLETRNAIQASDILVSVIQPEQYSVDGFETFMEDLKNEHAVLDHIVVNMAKNLNAHKKIIEGLKVKYGDILCNTIIPDDTKVREAAIERKLLMDYKPYSRANLAFEQLIKELWA